MKKFLIALFGITALILSGATNAQLPGATAVGVPNTPPVTLTSILALDNTVNLATCPGVVTGLGQSGAQRIANGAALQACLDAADTAGAYVAIPGVKIEYTASGTQGGTATGLHVKKGVRGVLGRSSADSMFVQFATNFPALTIGDMGTTAADQTFQGTYTNFAVGFGTSQSGQTSGFGLQLGRIWGSTFDNIEISPFVAGGGRVEAYIGLNIPNVTNGFFFANTLPNISVRTGLQRIFQQTANGTGNAWGVLYLGGGTFGDFRACATFGCMYVQNVTNFGTIDLLKLEWMQTSSGGSVITIDNVGGFNAQQVRFEGNKLIGFSPQMFNVSLSNVNIGQMLLFDTTIASADVTGNPTIFSAFSNSNISVAGGQWWWNSASATFNSTLRFFSQDSGAGNRSRVSIGNTPIINSTGFTGVINPDASLLASAIGTLTAFGKYVYNPVQSTIDQAEIAAPSGGGVINVPASLTNAKIVVSTAIAADRSVIPLNTATGANYVRPTPDTINVYRTSASTGAFNVNIRNMANSSTTASLGTAGTATTVVVQP